MSLYTNKRHQTVANGFPSKMDDKISKIVFIDVTPARTPYLKKPSSNVIVPMKNNLTSPPTIYNDIVYENLKPVFTILRAMGVLPLTKKGPGVNQFQFASPAMMYSAIIYFSLVSYILYLSLHKVQILRSAEGKFEEAVIEYLFTVYLFPMTVVPILWYETRKIADVLNGWVDFEVSCNIH